MKPPIYHVAITLRADFGQATIEHDDASLREALYVVLEHAIRAGWIADDVPGSAGDKKGEPARA